MGVAEVIDAVNKPTRKLIEAVSGAIGKAYEPHHIKKMADAEAYRINTISEAMRNNCDMPISYSSADQTTTIDITDFEALVKRTGARIAFQELSKQKNIENVVDKAYEILEQESVVSNEPIDNGWMIRFMNHVGDISDEELQGIWSKILAGEVKKPNSVSLRTISILSNMSKRDAELFMKYCPFVLFDGEDNYFIFSESKDVLQKNGLKTNEILKLDECGLLNSDGLITANVEKIDGSATILCNKYFSLSATLKENASNQGFSFQIYPLTESGIELYKLISTEYNKEYICDITEYLKSTQSNYNMVLNFSN